MVTQNKIISLKINDNLLLNLDNLCGQLHVSRSSVIKVLIELCLISPPVANFVEKQLKAKK